MSKKIKAKQIMRETDAEHRSKTSNTIEINTL